MSASRSPGRTAKTLLISRSAMMSQGLNAPLCRGKSPSMTLRRSEMTRQKRFGRKCCQQGHGEHD